MTDSRSGDKGKRGDQSAATQPEESHVHKGLFGGLKDFGNSALHKTQELAHDVSDGVKKNAPKVIHAAKEAADSPTGRKIQGAGKDLVNDEKNRGVGLYDDLKKGKVLKVATEVPFALSPHAVIANEALHVFGKELEKSTPVEHKGAVKQVLGAKDIISGNGFPSAKGLIVDGLTHPETQKQAFSLGKQTADGISNLWHKATGSHSEDNRTDKERAEDIQAERAKAVKHPHTGKQ